MPMFNRVDVSIMQDIFKNIGGKRNAGQIRFDMTNFGNLLNHNWGVSQRLVLPHDGGQWRADPDQRRSRRTGPRQLPDGGSEQRAG
jgi:hypothetical protein